ncbi:MAG: NAD(+) diphosphatase [Butyrivibrio sp.]|nr:NAD(+) diphosphatase [Butyrivibrio sp.]
MIQDISPSKLDNHYDPSKNPTDGSIILVFSKEKNLLGNLNEDTKEISFPRYKDFSGLEKEKLTYLFTIDGEEFFLLLTDAEDKSLLSLNASAVSSYEFNIFRTYRNSYFYPKTYVYAAFTAYQLAEWYMVTKFCGRCGAENKHSTKERAMICPKCGNIIYPRINPAVIIGVIDKEAGKLLLTKYKTGYGHNALVAGFTEIGETLEETVSREVMEEVGLTVTNIRYYKSQPWGIASDILVGFFCDVTGKREITMDQGELRFASWLSPEDVELQPLEYSLTNEMMKMFKEGKII